MLTPEEDFLTWGAMLIACVEENQLEEMMPDFNRLVEDIVQEGHLKDPIADQSEYFLKTIVRSVATGILNMRSVAWNVKALVKTTLLGFTKLFTWGFVHDDFHVMASVVGVFSEKSELYYVSSTARYTSELLYGAAEEFLAGDAAFQLKDRVIDEERPLVLDHFEYLYGVYLEIANVMLIQDDLVSQTIPTFKAFLDKMYDDGFKNTDLTKLWKVINSVMEYFEKTQIAEGTDIYGFLFDYGEKMMSLDISRQIVGGQILEFGAKSNRDAKDAFQEWKSRTKLVDLLIERDLHPQLLEVIESVFDSLLDGKSLEAFMEKVKNAHWSEQSRMLGIAARALPNLSSEELAGFIAKVFSSNESLSDQMIEFLASAVTSLTYTHPDVCDQIIDTLIRLGTDPAKVDVVLSGIKQMAKGRQRIVYEKAVAALVEKLDDSGTLLFAASALLILANECYYLTQDFPADIDQTVAHAVKNMHPVGETREKMFELLAVIEEKKATGIRSDLIHLLVESGLDDTFWGFLHRVIEKLGKKAVTADGWEDLSNQVKRMEMEKASLRFVEFLKVFVLNLNYSNGIIISEESSYYQHTTRFPAYYSISEWPLECFECVMKCLAQSEAEDVAKFAQEMIITAIEKAKSIDVATIVQYLLTFFEDARDNREKARVLGLMAAYLDKAEAGVEVSDFGFERHKTTRSANRLELIVSYEGEKRTYLADKWSKPWDLKERIGKQIGQYPGYVQLLYRGYNISSYTTLGQAGLVTGALIQVTVTPNSYPVGPARPCPTLLFHKHGLASKVCKIVEKSSDPVVLKQCEIILNKLPSNPEVIDGLQNMESFVQTLQSANDYFFGYCIAIFSRKLDDPEIVDGFRKYSGCTVVINHLVAHPDGCHGLGCLLHVIQKMFGEEVLQRARDLIPIILRLFPLKKAPLLTLATILCQFGETDKDLTTNITLECFAALSTAIRCVNYQCYQPFYRYISTLTNKVKLAFMCLEHTDSSTRKEHNYFNDILVSIITDIDEEESIREILQKCLIKFPESSGNAMGSLCKVISTIVSEHPELKEECKNIGADILPLACSTMDNTLRADILGLCETLNIGKDDASLEVLRKIFDIDTDRWNYQPETNQQTLEGFVGLRNLGSTCYMNSILQQLFYTYPFRYLILTSEMKDESQLRLKKIFTELVFSSRKYSDTQPFCAIWKGWMKRPINPREQQDANEFLQLLLDQLPADFHDMFKGEIENKIEGMTEDFSSSNTEMFYSLCLDVKGCKDVDESFKSFIRSETFTGDNQYSIGDRKIDARKFARIQKAPKVLVLQLKRFEYNLTTFARYKVNDKFEFGREINIQEYMSDPSVPQWYQLKGVVVHSGTAEGGHYSSIVLVDGKWIMFNDRDVSELSDEQFQETTLGGSVGYQDEYESKPSAYMLFYSRRDATVEVNGEILSLDVAPDTESKCDPEIVRGIEEENREYMRFQSAFSASMFRFVTDTQDPTLILEYFFNVFCHSSLTYEVKEMERALNSLIENDQYDINKLMNYIVEHYAKVEPIFINCGVVSIMEVFVQFLVNMLSICDLSQGFVLLNRIVGSLPIILGVSWKQLQYASACVEETLERQPAYLSMTMDSKWDEILTQFVSMVYDAQRSAMIFQNMNLSAIFNVLAMIYRNSHSELIPAIMKYAMTISQSPSHVYAFSNLVQLFYEHGAIDLNGYINALLQSKANVDCAYDTIIASMLKLTDEKDVSVMRDHIFQKRTKGDLLGFISRLSQQIRESGMYANAGKLMQVYPKETLFRFLVHESDEVRLKSFSLLEDILDDMKPDALTEAEQKIVQVLFDSCMDVMRSFVEDADISRYISHSESEYPDESEFRFVQLIGACRLLLKVKGQFCEDSFDILLKFLTSLLNTSRNSVDYNINQCFRTISMFPPAIFVPHFNTIFDQLFSHMEKQQYADVFARFKYLNRFIPDLSQEQVSLIIHHPCYPKIREGILVCGGKNSKVLSAFGDKLISFAAEPDIAREISTIFESREVWPRKASESFKRFVGKAVDYLEPESIQKFLDSVSDFVDQFLAMDYWEANDMCPIIFGVAAELMKSRHASEHMDWNAYNVNISRLCQICDETKHKEPLSFLLYLCRLKGGNFTNSLFNDIVSGAVDIRTNLDNICFVVYLGSGCYTEEEEISYITSLAYKRKVDMLMKQTELVISTTNSIPSWSKAALVACVKEDCWYCDPERTPVVPQIIASMTPAERVDLLHAVPRFDASYELIFVAFLFKTYPEQREEFMQVLPDKTRPRTSSHWDREYYDIIYGPEKTDATNLSDDDSDDFR